MANFVVIDFETASLSKTSAIEVGLVRFRDGEPVAQYQSLICPPQHEVWAEQAIQLHGLRPEDVAGQPEFAELYEEILSFIGQDPLVGHNLLSFDLPVLQETAAFYGLEVPTFNVVIDTLLLSQKHVKSKSYKLGDLARGFSISNPQAHRAIGDCLTTGYLLTTLLQTLSTSLEEIGQIAPGRIAIAASERSPAMPEKALRKSDADRIRLEKGNPDGPLSGSEVVFSGNFLRYSKQEIQLLCIEHGGTTKDNVSAKTTYLVTNEPNSNTSKLTKAREYQSKGHQITIISESDFERLIGL